MPQLVKGVMEHPNLSQTDYTMMDTYCQMFELDWRGDRAMTNKKEFLATHPIYTAERDRPNFEGYGGLGEFEAAALLRQACTPFVADLTAKLMDKAKDRKK